MEEDPTDFAADPRNIVVELSFDAFAPLAWTSEILHLLAPDEMSVIVGGWPKRCHDINTGAYVITMGGLRFAFSTHVVHIIHICYTYYI